MNKRWARFVLVFLIPTLILSGCATSSNPNITQSYKGDSYLTQEINAGEEIHNQILSTFYIYTEPTMVAYVNRVGVSVAQFAERQELPYRFTLLYSDKIYATSAPGGFVYLTTAMVHFLKNEAELAAVLAHEIAHLQYKNPRFSRSKKIIEGITTTGAAIAPVFGQFGALAILGIMMLNMIADTAEKSISERLIDADKRALQYLMRAGYDPQALLDFLRRFLSAERSFLPYFYDYYQSRPLTEERMTSIVYEFEALPLMDRELMTNPMEYREITKGVSQIYER